MLKFNTVRAFNLSPYIFAGKIAVYTPKPSLDVRQHIFAPFRASIRAILLRKNAARHKRSIFDAISRQTSDIVAGATMSEFNAERAQNGSFIVYCLRLNDRKGDTAYE